MVASSTPFLLRISDGCSKVSAVAARAATGNSAASGAAIAAPQPKMFGAVSATPVRPTVVRNDRLSIGERFGIIRRLPRSVGSDEHAAANVRSEEHTSELQSL